MQSDHAFLWHAGLHMCQNSWYIKMQSQVLGGVSVKAAWAGCRMPLPRAQPSPHFFTSGQPLYTHLFLHYGKGYLLPSAQEMT